MAENRSNLSTRSALVGNRTLPALLLTSVLVASCTGSSGANDSGDAAPTFELKLAGHLDANGAQGKTITWWIAEVEKRSGGRIAIEPFWSGSLVPGPEIMPAVAEGRADLGWFASTYHPDLLPYTYVHSLPFVTSNVPAQMATFNELYADEASPVRREWDEQQQMVLSFIGAPPSVLATREPLESLDEIDGQSFRSVGFLGQAIEKAGGKPVSIAGSEIYQALSTGVVDGVSGITFDLIPTMKLNEVAPHVTDTQLGNYSLIQLTIGAAAWEQLPEDLQSVIIDVSDEFPAKLMEMYVEAETSACDAILEAEGTVTRLPESEVERWRDLLGDDALEAWMDSVGSDGQEFFNTYTEKLEAHTQEFLDYVPGMVTCAEENA